MSFSTLNTYVLNAVVALYICNLFISIAIYLKRLYYFVLVKLNTILFPTQNAALNNITNMCQAREQTVFSFSGGKKWKLNKQYSSSYIQLQRLFLNISST